MKPRHPIRLVHPSELIDEEMFARGWSLDDYALAAHPEGGTAAAVSKLAMELYFAVGPANPNLLMGDETAGELARVFGTDVDYWRNLHSVWSKWFKGSSSLLPVEPAAPNAEGAR